MPIPEHLALLLRRLTVGDEATLDQLLRGQITSSLDYRTAALARVAALVGLEADSASYQVGVDNARAAGVEDQEILEAVMSVSNLVGAARLSTALSGLAEALGDDTLAD